MSRPRKAPKHPRRRRPVPATSRVRDWGRKDAQSNVAADWIAFNREIDQLVGRPFDPEAWPYCDFKRKSVEEFVGSLPDVAVQHGSR